VATLSPVTAGLPGARSTVIVQRDWSEKKAPQTVKHHTRVFLFSLREQERARAAQAVREHWSVENRNHYKRDVSAWQEDAHRHRRPKAALKLALTRNALLALIPFEQGLPLAHCFELCHRHLAKAHTPHSEIPSRFMILPTKRPA
jgi:predicted transposase YbfD/YdcC